MGFSHSEKKINAVWFSQSPEGILEVLCSSQMNFRLQHSKILWVPKCNYVKQVQGKHERHKATCPDLLAGSS